MSNHTDPKKKEAALKAFENRGKKSVHQVAKDVGVGYSTLQRWVYQRETPIKTLRKTGVNPSIAQKSLEAKVTEFVKAVLPMVLR